VTKKIYLRPKLTKYGRIESLTTGASIGSFADGASGMASTMTMGMGMGMAKATPLGTGMA